MTRFSLRKRDPEPEPELVDDQVDGAEDEEEEEAEATPRPRGALTAGAVGWFTWTNHHIGTGWTYTIHAVAVWACTYYGGWVTVLVPAGFLLVVGLFTPREHLDRATAWIEQRTAGRTPDEPAHEPDDEAPVDPLVTVLWRLIGDAPGVHVKTLAEHLRAAAPEEAVDRPAVRAKLGARGIPVRASVRDASGRVNEGVHQADLRAWQEALPSTDPAALPEARSRPVATAVTCDVADAPTPVATPSSPLRKLLSRGGA